MNFRRRASSAELDNSSRRSSTSPPPGASTAASIERGSAELASGIVRASSWIGARLKELAVDAARHINEIRDDVEREDEQMKRDRGRGRSNGGRRRRSTPSSSSSSSLSSTTKGKAQSNRQLLHRRSSAPSSESRVGSRNSGKNNKKQGNEKSDLDVAAEVTGEAARLSKEAFSGVAGLLRTAGTHLSEAVQDTDLYKKAETRVSSSKRLTAAATVTRALASGVGDQLYAVRAGAGAIGSEGKAAVVEITTERHGEEAGTRAGKVVDCAGNVGSAAMHVTGIVDGRAAVHGLAIEAGDSMLSKNQDRMSGPILAQGKAVVMEGGIVQQKYSADCVLRSSGLSVTPHQQQDGAGRSSSQRSSASGSADRGKTRFVAGDDMAKVVGLWEAGSSSSSSSSKGSGKGSSKGSSSKSGKNGKDMVVNRRFVLSLRRGARITFEVATGHQAKSWVKSLDDVRKNSRRAKALGETGASSS